MPLATPDSPPLPALWHEPAPRHFDSAIPWWIKAGIVALATIAAILFVDQRVAVFAKAHPIPDIGRVSSEGPKGPGDIGRDLMFLEQWGQVSCVVVVVLAVGLLDPAGRRRALAIVIACVVTVALTHLLKDLIGRSRPFRVAGGEDGHWVWGGPGIGFKGGASWTSFPSAHTTGAFALASALAWFYPRGRALFVSLAVITACERVLHTAHYVSDTLAGMGVGVMVARLTLTWGLAGRLLAVMPASVRDWYARAL